MTKQYGSNRGFVERVDKVAITGRARAELRLHKALAETERGLAQIAFRNFIHQPHGLGVKRGNRCARENHIQRPAGTDQPWEALCPARARNDSQRDFWHSKFCVFVGEAIMTGHGQFQSSTESETVYRDDYRQW